MLVVGVQPLHLQNGWDVEQPLSFQEEDEMDKTGEREAQWRLHVGALQASGATQKAYCEQRIQRIAAEKPANTGLEGNTKP